MSRVDSAGTGIELSAPSTASIKVGSISPLGTFFQFSFSGLTSSADCDTKEAKQQDSLPTMADGQRNSLDCRQKQCTQIVQVVCRW